MKEMQRSIQGHINRHQTLLSTNTSSVNPKYCLIATAIGSQKERIIANMSTLEMINQHIQPSLFNTNNNLTRSANLQRAALTDRNRMVSADHATTIRSITSLPSGVLENVDTCGTFLGEGVS